MVKRCRPFEGVVQLLQPRLSLSLLLPSRCGGIESRRASNNLRNGDNTNKENVTRCKVQLETRDFAVEGISSLSAGAIQAAITRWPER